MRPAEGYLKFYFDGSGRHTDNIKAAAAPQVVKTNPLNVSITSFITSSITSHQMTDSSAPATVMAAMPGRLCFRRSSMA